MHLYYTINLCMANCKKRGTLFCSWITVCTIAKGEKYSEDSHDAEAILAHYRVDKPFKRIYQL